MKKYDLSPLGGEVLLFERNRLFQSLFPIVLTTRLNKLIGRVPALRLCYRVRLSQQIAQPSRVCAPTGYRAKIHQAEVNHVELLRTISTNEVCGREIPLYNTTFNGARDKRDHLPERRTLRVCDQAKEPA
ncbi:MAG: hypothetical protein JO319_15155 [Acidobacteriaceae bacterium]|nr:hypothetical protein [Acidobacteriaceae bacterium]